MRFVNFAILVLLVSRGSGTTTNAQQDSHHTYWNFGGNCSGTCSGDDHAFPRSPHVRYERSTRIIDSDAWWFPGLELISQRSCRVSLCLGIWPDLAFASLHDAGDALSGGMGMSSSNVSRNTLRIGSYSRRCNWRNH